MMKKTALFLVFILIAASFPALALETECPSCGTPGTGWYCAQCGSKLHPGEDHQAEEYGPGLYRAPAETGFVTADSLSSRYQTTDKNAVPVYLPSSPQPMNAYLVADRLCEVGIDGDGMYKVSEDGRIRSMAPLLREWAQEITDQSRGAIRFVSDPDSADLLIGARQAFQYYADYTGGGFTSKGYSSVITLQAFQLTDLSHSTSMTVRNDPGEQESLKRNSSKFWKKPPELEGSKQLAVFVETILSWYGGDPSVRDGIMAAQNSLADRGYLDGPGDGQWEARTEWAVRLLQEEYYLPVTGRMDTATLIAVYFDKQAAHEALSRYQDLKDGDTNPSDSTCPECRWTYPALAGYAYCPHCGSALLWTIDVPLPGKNMEPGDIVRFGLYQQDIVPGCGPDAIEWIVLEVREFAGERRALLLSRYALDCRVYHPEFDRSIQWVRSSLRGWLNGGFLSEAFGDKEQAVIAYSNLSNGDETRYTGWVVKGGPHTEDRIFLLSWTDVFETYFDSDEARKCFPTPYARLQGEGGEGSGSVSWWLRSPGNGQGSASAVSPEGTLDYHTVPTSYFGVNHCAVYVRPALWIDLDALPE